MKTSANPVHRPTWLFLGGLLTLALSGLISGCKTPVEPPPPLHELQVGENLKASGGRLIHTPLGVHRLTPPKTPSSTAILAVHGHKSRGYEWITSLHQFAETGAHVYWLRWDWNQCPTGGVEDLQKAIVQLQKENPAVEEIHIFGHSYGGVIATIWAQTVSPSVATHVHAIASPLAGMGKLSALCPPTGIDGKPLQAKVSFTQWRTQHKLDGAFKDEAVDPQLVTVPKARVVALPETFNGKRLGHNWSVSYSTTQWLETQKHPTPVKPVETHPPE